jgi:hypothetical protein
MRTPPLGGCGQLRLVAGGPDGDQQPAVGQHLRRAPDTGPADQVDHHIHLAGDGGEVGGGVVDRRIDTQRAEQLVLVGPGRAQHLGTEGLGDLHGQVPDPAAGGVDEDPLAGLETGGLGQHLPGGQPGQRQPGRLQMRQDDRLGGQVARGGGDILGIGALAVVQHAVDLLAGPERSSLP